MEWLDNLYARYMTGENPEDIYTDYKTHIAAEADEARHTPIPKDTAKLLTAWESWRQGDTDRLSQWLNQDGTALTPEATRMLYDGFDMREAQSQ